MMNPEEVEHFKTKVYTEWDLSRILGIFFYQNVNHFLI